MDFQDMVLKALVEAAEDRQQPVVDWLNAWKRCEKLEPVILAGLRLSDHGDERVEVEVNGEMAVLLGYFQVAELKRRLLALLKR